MENIVGSVNLFHYPILPALIVIASAVTLSWGYQTSTMVKSCLVSCHSH